MKLEKIDANFVIDDGVSKNGMKYYNIPNDNFALYGVFYDEKLSRFVRMDGDIASKISEGVKTLSQHTAGGRLRFSTDSSKMEISVTYDELWIISNMAMLGSSGFILMEENDDGSFGFYKSLMPTSDQKKGFNLTVNLPGKKVRNYVLWFPLYNPVTSLTIGVEENAVVGKGRSYKNVKPILYYGSSIVQGAAASRPDNCYQGFICKWNNVDFINMGFSGSGLGEELMIKHLCGIDCGLFVCDYGHHVRNVEFLRKNHYVLYEAFRKTHKDVPIIFTTVYTDPIDGEEATKARRRIIRSTYLKAKKNGDNNVYFLDGDTTIGKKDRIRCTPDYRHPNDMGMYRIAEKLYKKMSKIDKIFE